MEPNPKAELIEAVYHIWTTAHLNEMHGYKDPQCFFKFICNEEGKALMHFRNWTSSPWYSDSDAMVVLKVPDNTPQFSIPSIII